MGKRLWVERNEDGSWDAFSEDGAHIKFGKGAGLFTPGDLMKIALAGCSALTVSRALEHSEEQASVARIVADGQYVADTDSFTGFEETVVIERKNPTDNSADNLRNTASAALQRGCTVKHTYEEATPVRVAIEVR